MDGLPADGLQDIRQLRRDVVQAQKTAGSRSAATRASKGWKLGTDDPPDFDDLEPGEVHIRGEGDFLVVRSQGGDIVVREHSPGAPVDIVPNMTAGTIGGAPTMAQYNNLYNDLVAARATVNELIGSLRGNDTILT